ncbi:FAD-dependent oxidoreductase [Microbacterium sp. p3-SID336]|uniref:FAD-dependent oxidoreductase n=1 Tax=Microbacterium sp. p3-SID336 TaxID=2916212 RepID=UPI0021A88D78|nr:FAD-dependent oxidoreductase [Microbacterium sp. p3-SID336]MCT1476454.1 FAD-dependent oxidoreductase [Microbacterium sp. p3-SID336]
MDGSASPRTEVLVVGAGPAAYAFAAELLRHPDRALRLTVIGEEEQAVPDRAVVAELLRDSPPTARSTVRGVLADERVRLVTGERVQKIDRALRRVRTRSGRHYGYDVLVLATGAAPVVRADGAWSARGCLALWTRDDAADLQALLRARVHERGGALHATVVGGGTAGLSASLALRASGVAVTLALTEDRLLAETMSRDAEQALRQHVEALGVRVRAGGPLSMIDVDESGSVAAVEFRDGGFLRTDAVVFAGEARPRDELARNAGLAVHPSGGVIVDTSGVTSDPNIVAVGEVAVCGPRRSRGLAAVRSSARRAAAALCGVPAPMDDAPSVHAVLGEAEVLHLPGPVLTDPELVVVPLARSTRLVHGELLLSTDGRRLHGATVLGERALVAALQSAAGPHARAGALIALLADGASEPCSCGREQAARTSVRAFGGRGASGSADLAVAAGVRACPPCVRALAVEAITTVAAVTVADHDADDGSPVMVPVPGELTPQQLGALAGIAEEFDLRVRIGGEAHGIVLRGATPAQVPLLLQRLGSSGLLPRQLDDVSASEHEERRGSVHARRPSASRAVSPA